MPVFTTAFTGAHCAYLRRNGQADLIWIAGYILRWFTQLSTVSHPNRLGLKLTNQHNNIKNKTNHARTTKIMTYKHDIHTYK